MSRSLCLVLALAFVAVVLPACEPIEDPGANRLPSISFLDLTDSVPRSYGRLVAVTPSGQNPASMSLWFEADDQTITAVRVNASTGAISKEVITVPRN